MTALHDLSVAALAAELRAKRVSAVETAQHFLARAAHHTARLGAPAEGASNGAFVALNEEATLAQARAADARLAAGTAGRLEGEIGRAHV